MDMDAAGLIGDSASFPQEPDDFLEVLHILILENGADNFAGIIPIRVYQNTITFSFGVDAAIRHSPPDTSLSVGSGIGVVGPANMAAAGAEVVGNHIGGFLAGYARQFNFNPEVLFFHALVCHLPGLLEISPEVWYNSFARASRLWFCGAVRYFSRAVGYSLLLQFIVQLVDSFPYNLRHTLSSCFAQRVDFLLCSLVNADAEHFAFGVVGQLRAFSDSQRVHLTFIVATVMLYHSPFVSSRVTYKIFYDIEKAPSVYRSGL